LGESSVHQGEVQLCLEHKANIIRGGINEKPLKVYTCRPKHQGLVLDSSRPSSGMVES